MCGCAYGPITYSIPLPAVPVCIRILADSMAHALECKQLRLKPSFSCKRGSVHVKQDFIIGTCAVHVEQSFVHMCHVSLRFVVGVGVAVSCTCIIAQLGIRCYFHAWFSICFICSVIVFYVHVCYTYICFLYCDCALRYCTPVGGAVKIVYVHTHAHSRARLRLPVRTHT